MNIRTKEFAIPELSHPITPVELSDETMNRRKDRLLSAMAKQQFDVAVIYADREHAANFEYFTGFIPRFEEALLVVHKNKKAFLLLGNENLKMVHYSRIDAELIHVPFFSLPNQPMAGDDCFDHYLKQAEIKADHKVAVIGWKNFTSKFEDNQKLFDVPHFMIEGIKRIISDGETVVNGTALLISPQDGIRTVNNANEIAHYEYGATLSGIGILNTLNKVRPGITELELAGTLQQFGQPNNVTTICATGDRFTNANIYPRNKPVALGDSFSVSVGYKGGLSSRAAYVVSGRDELADTVSDYEEKVAHPYFKAVVTWLENLRIGMKAADMYHLIETVLPKQQYHWELNPGHYVADEEWLASPFYQGSDSIIKSGQMFQIDIIPRVAGYGGVGCEDGIVIADHDLRREIQENYPDLWSRFVRRRNYLRQVLNINISEEILPLNDIVAYYRPFLLNHKLALGVEQEGGL